VGAVYAFPLASVTLVPDQNPPRDPLTPETYVQRFQAAVGRVFRPGVS
jgi:hypothetical protein